MTDETAERRRFTVADLADRKRRKIPIVMATAYDFVTANAIDDAGIDIALVGDSAAMTVLGLPATREVTIEEMLMLTRAVRRGLTRAMLIGDLPFGTYEQSDEQAVASAARFADAGCDVLKMEGAGDILSRVRAVTATGMPVFGHVGLTPQILQPGDTPRVEGRTADAALRLLDNAQALEAAGCVGLIFEAVPALVSEQIVPMLRIPVVGIGAGIATDGQVLVANDLLGLTRGHVPRFVKRYGELGAAMTAAFERFAGDVRARTFPEAVHTYRMDAEQLASFSEKLRARSQD